MRLLLISGLFTIFSANSANSNNVAGDIAGATADVPKNLRKTDYKPSSLSNCRHYNFLINSLDHRIDDGTTSSRKEFDNCGEMIKKQSTSDYWENFGADKIMEKFDAQKTQKKLQTVAKNIILFVGGGMNVDTIGAARIQAGKFEATRKNQPGCGEEHELSFDKFPYSGFCKTYSLNSQTPSSRSAGTALLSGFKSKSGSLNCFNDKKCKEKNDNKPVLPRSLLFKMKRSRGVEKFKTGIVTNTQFYDGTTAAAFSKQKNKGGKSIKKIANGLNYALEKKLLDLSFSGGLDTFRNTVSKQRNDIVTTKKMMQSLIASNDSRTEPFVGMFAKEELLFEDERCNENNNEEPSLSEMAEKAVELLASGSENGFFLMVEAGNIERAHQKTQGLRAVNEAVELDSAVQAVKKQLKNLQHETKHRNIFQETLMIVTADHGHTFTFGQWDSPRGIKVSKRPQKGPAALIFDIGGILSESSPVGGYYAGPGKNHVKTNLKHENNIDVKHMSAVDTENTPISGEDVPVFAEGPFAHLFSGVMEQSYVGSTMAFAACTKEFCKETHCKAAGFKC